MISDHWLLECLYCDKFRYNNGLLKWIRSSRQLNKEAVQEGSPMSCRCPRKEHKWQGRAILSFSEVFGVQLSPISAGAKDCV